MTTERRSDHEDHIAVSGCSCFISLFCHLAHLITNLWSFGRELFFENPVSPSDWKSVSLSAILIHIVLEGYIINALNPEEFKGKYDKEEDHLKFVIAKDC
ncbi:hypothetical protein RRG08_007381 [Elysia crispata]|uniref:Uncharacterized protein n=1 Tax=Elysia crispata TaxID=231223 RepID=A0AAE1AR26_9GAST|nr:hypothetical protein RRG08_007381 [Elysia crispata]